MKKINLKTITLKQIKKLPLSQRILIFDLIYNYESTKDPLNTVIGISMSEYRNNYLYELISGESTRKKVMDSMESIISNKTFKEFQNQL